MRRRVAAVVMSGLALTGTAYLGAQALEVAGVVNFVLEGPTADADGNLYFTDVNASRILRLGTDGRITTFRQPANRANGMVFDGQFRLLIAEMGDAANNVSGRVIRTDMKTGKIEVLADNYEGTPFRDTNDITIDGKGRLDLLTNTAFGGPELKTLYITAGNTIFKVPVKVAGTRR